MEILTFVLGAFSLTGVLGTLAGSYYGIKQKTTIDVLERSNKAFAERNIQLEKQAIDDKAYYIKKISALEGRVFSLEQIKTPPFTPLFNMIAKNHKELMTSLNGAVNDGTTHDSGTNK